MWLPRVNIPKSDMRKHLISKYLLPKLMRHVKKYCRESSKNVIYWSRMLLQAGSEKRKNFHIKIAIVPLYYCTIVHMMYVFLKSRARFRFWRADAERLPKGEQSRKWRGVRKWTSWREGRLLFGAQVSEIDGPYLVDFFSCGYVLL